MSNTYPTSQYPLGSTEVKVLYNNASNLDDAVNGPDPTWTDRFGSLRKSWAGIESDFAQFLLASGYEFIGDYDAPGELTFTRPNQMMSKGGDYWRPGPGLALPYTTVNNWTIDQPKFVGMGDASLRSALAGLDGSTLIGFGGRTVYDKLREHVSVKDAPFNAVGDGVTDDTAAIQAFFDYLAAQTQAGLTTSGPYTTSYTGTAPVGFFPYGTYKVTAAVNVGSYVEIVGEQSIIKQYTDDADIFNVALYQFKMSGMQFIGGRQQLVFSNANINSSMLRVEGCGFFLSRSYAIKTFATGGVWSHLSCDAKFINCRIIACRQAMDNCCDSMLLENCWVQPDKANMTASTPVFNNRGAYPIDMHPQTRLRFHGGFFIPNVGTEGVDRVNNVRWVDNYGSFSAFEARFGGEFGGMQIVAHLGPPDYDFPWNTTEVVIEGGMAFCGPDSRADSCLIAIQGHVPNHIRVHNVSGPVGKPIVANISSTDLAAYFATFQSNSGKAAYEYFKIDISGVITDLRAYSPVRAMIPDGLYPYLTRGRNTRVRRQTQTLLNAFANNLVSFNTIDFDNVGAFAIANQTRLVMPAGCSKMQVEVNVTVAVDGAAKTFAVHIDDSGGGHWKGVTELRGNNPNSDQFHFTANVYGPPGSYWTLNVRHNAAASLNLLDARVVLTPLDMMI